VTTLIWLLVLWLGFQ